MRHPGTSCGAGKGHNTEMLLGCTSHIAFSADSTPHPQQDCCVAPRIEQLHAQQGGGLLPSALLVFAPFIPFCPHKKSCWALSSPVSKERSSGASPHCALAPTTALWGIQASVVLLPHSSREVLLAVHFNRASLLEALKPQPNMQGPSPPVPPAPAPSAHCLLPRLAPSPTAHVGNQPHGLHSRTLPMPGPCKRSLCC